MAENPPDQTAAQVAAMINAVNRERFPAETAAGTIHVVQSGPVMVTAIPEPPKEEGKD